jgi:DeoR family transcriptional regulator, fructose operon transcriptional repressor
LQLIPAKYAELIAHFFKLVAMELLKEERLGFIINQVRLKNRVLLTDLATQLNVSEDTVRRDLKQLDAQGKIRKVHGGAILNHPYTYKNNEVYAIEKKTSIAHKAQQLLREGQVILISGGTTNLEFVRTIPSHFSLTVFTPSLPVALLLSEHPNVETIVLGGRMSPEAQVTVGAEPVKILSDLKADICFLGTGQLDTSHGLTEFDWEVVQLKKAMIQASKKVVSLTISEKINSFQRYRVCGINSINILITELEPSDSKVGPYRDLGIEVQ